MEIPRNTLTGEPLQVKYTRGTIQFRGKQYEATNIAFIDEDGELFTTTESDTLWYNQATNRYRSEHGIPFTDEIASLRDRYGLSAIKMSEILGFGANQWRLYETGEVPSESNGKMIRSVMNPKVMLDLVEHSRGQFTDREYSRVRDKILAAVRQSDDYHRELYDCSRLFPVERSLLNGYAPRDTRRLKTLLLHIIGQCGSLYKTQLNKLLFYIDFLSYRERGMAISGLPYRAIMFGPVPERYERVYSEFDEIEPRQTMIQNTEATMLTSSTLADTTCLSEEELRIVGTVCQKFGSLTSRQFSDISHQEPAWRNHRPDQSLIPFDEAFSLAAL